MAVSKQDRFKKYERALLDAFPTWNELDKMVFGALGEVWKRLWDGERCKRWFSGFCGGRSRGGDWKS